MARQKSIIKLKGTLGDITFYKTRDGHMARERGGVSADRIMNDPAFQRTRENGAEFGRAGRAGKTLRRSIQTLLQNAADPRMVSRLTREMIKVLQMDAINPRGLRNVIDGEAEMLQGFEFNSEGKLGTTLFAPYETTIDRAAGTASVELQPFVPADSIGVPSGSTHFQLVAAAMAVDFTQEKSVSEKTETQVLPINNVATSLIQLAHTLPADSPHPLFVVLGISFFQEVNGSFYALKNGGYNALQIVQVSGTP